MFQGLLLSVLYVVQLWVSVLVPTTARGSVFGDGWVSSGPVWPLGIPDRKCDLWFFAVENSLFECYNVVILKIRYTFILGSSNNPFDYWSSTICFSDVHKVYLQWTYSLFCVVTGAWCSLTVWRTLFLKLMSGAYKQRHNPSSSILLLINRNKLLLVSAGGLPSIPYPMPKLFLPLFRLPYGWSYAH